MPEAIFFWATTINTEDEFYLRKGNEDSQRELSQPSLTVVGPNFKSARLVPAAPELHSTDVGQDKAALESSSLGSFCRLNLPQLHCY